MGFNFIKLAFEGKVAKLQLNRPEAYNALNVEMIEEIVLALKEVKDSDTDILLLSGNGKGFCAGGDIKSMLSLNGETNFQRIMDSINEMIITLYTIPKLTISVIHGPVAGLGLSMVLATDYAIASEQAVLAMNFIGIGLIPDGGGHFFLKAKVGEHQAKQIIWDGKNLGAPEAYQHGLIDEVVALAELDGRVIAKIEEWLQKPREAMLQSKEIFAKESLPNLLNVLEQEKTGQSNMRKTKDHLEGIKAFVEKRKPVFNGE